MSNEKIKEFAACVTQTLAMVVGPVAAGLVEDAAIMGRLQNEVCCLSSCACAERIDECAKKLAVARACPAMDTYTAIMEEATAMLARGDDQNAVVLHFGMMVEKEYERI